MRPYWSSLLALALPVALLSSGCFDKPDDDDDDDDWGDEDGGDGDSGGRDQTDTDTDADSDADTDSDADADTDTDTDTDADADPLELSAVEPAFGSTAGGSTLVLTGAGFNETAEVWLGGVSAEVVSVGPAELVVESPPASAAGLVNVQVSTSAETATLDEAFRYWADATGEVSLVGGVVRFNQVGGYWSDGGGTSGAAAELFAIEPGDYEAWQLFADEMDSCRGGASLFDTVTRLDPETALVQLTPTAGGGSAMELAWDASTLQFRSGEVDAGVAAAGTTWLLEAASADDLLPPVEVADLVTMATAPTVTVPAITGDAVPYIDRAQAFSWSPTGADWVLITMAVLDSTGAGYAEVVNCVAMDDGRFTMDGDQFSSWPTGRQVNVFVGTVYESTPALPWNNGRGALFGLARVYGAGFSQ